LTAGPLSWVERESISVARVATGQNLRDSDDLVSAISDLSRVSYEIFQAALAHESFELYLEIVRAKVVQSLTSRHVGYRGNRSRVYGRPRRQRRVV